MGDTHTVADCLFCKIVAGEVPGEVVHVTERTVAFRDINAQAPTHVLVVPREHYPNAAALAAGDPEATAELVTHGRGGRRPPRATRTTAWSSTPARASARASSTPTCTCSPAAP